jgi:hypothetical protein
MEMLHKLIRRIRARLGRPTGTLYVVAGLKRSGTTMMMQALEAGGMDVARAGRIDYAEHEVYETTADVRRRVWDDDTITGKPTKRHLRYPERYRGRLIKCLTGTARYLRIQPDGIKVVFIKRDIDAVRASWAAEFGNPIQVKSAEKSIASELQYWEQREDTDLVIVDYQFVLDNPVWTMQMLQSAGWPIDAKKAAAIIEPDRIHPPTLLRTEPAS